MDEQMIRTLIHEATSARRQAYAPYSHFWRRRGRS